MNGNKAKQYEEFSDSAYKIACRLNADLQKLVRFSQGVDNYQATYGDFGSLIDLSKAQHHLGKALARMRDVRLILQESARREMDE